MPAEYVVISGQIIQEMAKKLSKRHNMLVAGSTAGLADCVNVLGLTFQIPGPLPLEKLREILVDCVEEFLIMINSNERLRESLKTYPFTAEGIDITILVKDQYGYNVYFPGVGAASIAHGKVMYLAMEKDAIAPAKILHRETYKEAKELVGR